MPIWLRKFTFNKIQEHYDKVSDASQTKKPPSKKRPVGPDIKPAYTTQSSKK